MALSSLSSGKQVFDELRRIWTAATPEEIVRQTLLKRMVYELGYPKELIAVERELSSLPHLAQKRVPSRRIDILCFGKDIHPEYSLYPLLLIECKKEKAGLSALEQLLGYNSHVGAYFVAVAAKNELFFHFRGASLPFLPSYTQLVKALAHD